jgi:hypothetical protein
MVQDASACELANPTVASSPSSDSVFRRPRKSPVIRENDKTRPVTRHEETAALTFPFPAPPRSPPSAPLAGTPSRTSTRRPRRTVGK